MTQTKRHPENRGRFRSTLIAAHKTGRRGYLCEIDPVYCDRIIQRWETYAGDDAKLIDCVTDKAEVESIMQEVPAEQVSYANVIHLHTTATELREAA